MLDTVPPQSRCELPRTPLCKQKNGISIRDVQSKGKISSIAKQSRRKEFENSPPRNIAAGLKAAPAKLGDYEQSPPGKHPQGTDAKEKAVTGCFTPSHSLRRSPVKLGRKEYSAVQCYSLLVCCYLFAPFWVRLVACQVRHLHRPTLNCQGRPT